MPLVFLCRWSFCTFGAAGLGQQPACRRFPALSVVRAPWLCPGAALSLCYSCPCSCFPSLPVLPVAGPGPACPALSSSVVLSRRPGRRYRLCRWYRCYFIVVDRALWPVCPLLALVCLCRWSFSLSVAVPPSLPVPRFSCALHCASSVSSSSLSFCPSAVCPSFAPLFLRVLFFPFSFSSFLPFPAVAVPAVALCLPFPLPLLPVPFQPLPVARSFARLPFICRCHALCPPLLLCRSPLRSRLCPFLTLLL